jgi:D-glycero-D-manno-heptose 1,7-bisphosphate phosphatase
VANGQQIASKAKTSPTVALGKGARLLDVESATFVFYRICAFDRSAHPDPTAAEDSPRERTDAMTKALLLDRDGVVNVDRAYVHRTEDFVFVDGIFELGALAQALGFLLIVVTNQAGIARGYYTEADFQSLTAWMLEQFRARGVSVARVYHCPFHPTAGIGEYQRESFDRKPNPGMIIKAQRDFALDLSRSVLIGDKESDLEAGRAAGVRHNVKLIHGAGASDAPECYEFASLHAIGAWLGATFALPSAR